MAGVTILNGTNTLVNVSLSAGFNYDFHNKLAPNEYVVLTGGVLVSVNARYWAGEPTEYDRGLLDIGLFAGGAIISLIGFGLTFVGGAGTPLLLFGASIISGGLGLAIGGISVLAKELINTPAHVTAVELVADRKFLVSGKLAMTEKDGILSIEGGDSIRLEPLDESEFQARVKSGKIALALKEQLDADPAEKTYAYAKKSDLEAEGALDAPVWIYPSFCGVPDNDPVCWQTGDYYVETLPVKLMKPSDQLGPQRIQWRIQFVREYERDDVAGGPKADAFRFSQGTRYVGVKSTRPDGDKEIQASRQADDATLFFILKSADCYVFVPCSRQQTYLVNADGSTHQETKVVLDSINGPTPGRARWVIDPVGMGRKLPAKHFGMHGSSAWTRIYPALVRRNAVKIGDNPLCWAPEGRSTEMNAAVQLLNIRTDERTFTRFFQDPELDDDDCDQFFLVSQVDKHPFAQSWILGEQKGSIPRGTYPRLVAVGSGTVLPQTQFYIREWKGYLSFHPKDKPDWAVYVDGIGEGRNVYLAPWNGFQRSLARWAMIPQNSDLARAEGWGAT